MGNNKKACCIDCKKPYSEFGLDTVLSDSDWALIHPSKYGLLCSQCIINRASKMDNVIKVSLSISFTKDYHTK